MPFSGKRLSFAVLAFLNASIPLFRDAFTPLNAKIKGNVKIYIIFFAIFAKSAIKGAGIK